MKKVLFILSLIALASASFAAVSITDWGVCNWDTFNYDSDEPFMRDAEPNGFDFNRSSDTNLYRNADFGSKNVSGWVYDEDDVFTVTLTGFEDIYMPPVFGMDNVDNVIVEFRNKSKSANIRYAGDYIGAGTYGFDFDNVFSVYNGFGTGDAVDEIYIVLGHAYSSGTYSFANTTPNTYGSARFMMGRPETEVPEPGTIAYALVGLGSLAGIKRRIKK